MKKTLFFALAALLFASCAKNEVVELNREAISFGDAFVENATRAAIDGSYTNEKSNLASFQVYGTIGGSVNIFNGVEVVKNATTETVGNTWKYAQNNIQYWIDGKKYNFAAVVDGNVANATEVVTNTAGMPTQIKILDASAQKDVLYAANEYGEYNTDNETEVAFTFNHILSKVKFTAKVSTDLGADYSYTVSGITINRAAKDGVFTIGGEWADPSETYNPAFGNIATTSSESGAEASVLAAGNTAESNWERLMIPENINSITLTVKLFKGNDEVDSDTKTLTPDVDLAAGNAYNFILELGTPGSPITFRSETVTGWAGPADKTL